MLVIYTILVFSGIVALTQLPVELYPNISFGEISIIIEVRGGIPPTEVESLVSKPVEEAVGSVSYLAEMMSISKEGESTVVLSFEPGINMEFAALDVREKFARVKNKYCTHFTENDKSKLFFIRRLCLSVSRAAIVLYGFFISRYALRSRG